MYNVNDIAVSVEVLKVIRVNTGKSVDYLLKRIQSQVPQATNKQIVDALQKVTA